MIKIIQFPIQKQKTQQSQVSYLWDGNRQAQEYTDTHVFTTVYEQNSFEPVVRLVWLKADLLQSANDEIINTERESWEPEPKLIPDIEVYHYHNDHLGTPNELTNEDGEVIWLADYEAYGNTAKVVWREEQLESVQVTAEELQPIRFQGQSFDKETGLHYNRFRYFDPDLGMFISRDPIELLGSNNIFAYVPNPIGWIDPLGLKCRKVKKSKNCKGCKNFCPDEIKCNNFDQARNYALKWLKPRGFKAEKVNVSKFTGKTYGMMSMNEKVGFRVEYDTRCGAHINVFNGKETGTPHVTFPGTRSSVNNINKRYRLTSKPSSRPWS